MLTPAAEIVRDLIRHPSVGAFALVLVILGIVVGYLWGTSTFARAEAVSNLETTIQAKLTDQKDEIVAKLDEKIVRRDIRQTEDQIRKVTQQISLGLCVDQECRFNEAELDLLKRRVQSLRDELK